MRGLNTWHSCDCVTVTLHYHAWNFPHMIDLEFSHLLLLTLPPPCPRLVLGHLWKAFPMPEEQQQQLQLLPFFFSLTSHCPRMRKLPLSWNLIIFLLINQGDEKNNGETDQEQEMQDENNHQKEVHEENYEEEEEEEEERGAAAAKTRRRGEM